MRLPRFGIISLVTFLIVVLLQVNWGFPSGLVSVGHKEDRQFFPQSQVLAQTSEVRKAEADRLLEQGIEQFNTSQFEAALQSWQQALVIYQQIKDRQGEGNALGNLGLAYYVLGDYIQATAFLMTQFYQNLQQNLDKAQALRQAMLTTMNQYPQPLQWAAFTLIGEI